MTMLTEVARLIPTVYLASYQFVSKKARKHTGERTSGRTYDSYDQKLVKPSYDILESSRSPKLWKEKKKKKKSAL